MPFRVQADHGVTTLWLETPAAPVNILNQATAAQLVELLAAVSPGSTQALVIRSAQPGSFINGVGLLLSTVIRDVPSARRAIRPVYRAYDAMRACPVPTIAVVEGNCWGCGLEFMLTCRHRIAVDTADTQFRMTEVADYNDPPVFGGTHWLPLELGVPDALDLLVGGQRWSAGEARDRGLIQATVAPDDETGIADFIAQVIAGRVPDASARRRAFEPAWDMTLKLAREDITDLPDLYQPSRRHCVDLMEAAARSSTPNPADAETTSFAATTLHAKNAYHFFHVRQGAAQLAAPTQTPLPPRLGITGPADVRSAAGRLATDLLEAHGVIGTVLDSAATPALRLIDLDQHARVGIDPEPPLLVTDRPTADLPSCVPVLYRRGTFIELRDQEPEGRRMAARYLQRAGFQVARSVGERALGSRTLLGAYTAPLLAALAGGASVHDIAATFRTDGWLQAPHRTLAELPGLGSLAHAAARYLPAGLAEPDVLAQALAALRSPADWHRGSNLPHLMDTVLLSLLRAVRENLAGAGFPHPYAVDLAARELLDFPTHRLSLCAYLTPHRVTEMLERPAARALTPAHILAEAQHFADNAVPFYR